MGNGSETTTKFKADISELKKSMQEAKRQVAIANSEFKAVSSTMENWENSADGISAKLKQLDTVLKSQESILTSYKDQYRLTAEQYGENSKQAQDLIIKINNQQAAINKTKSEINKYNRALDELENAANDADNAVDDLSDSVQDAGDSASKSEGGFTVLKGALAGLVKDGINLVLDGLKNLVTDSANAYAQFAAATGTATDAMGEYEDAIKSIYKNNFGESLEDIANKMAKVKEITGELDASKLQDMTEKAIILEDTFGMDMTETLRGVQSLMNHFGLSAEEAFDLMASGAQNGLNYTDELGDNVAEYAGKFAEAGYSADRYFQLLQNGSQGGAYNLDKVNDAINEVTTRLADGTIEDSLDMFSEDTKYYFELWKNGEATQREVIDEIVKNIQDTTNEQDKMNLAAKAFGTMAEDGGTKFIESLSALGDTFNDVQGKADKLAAVKYDTPMAAIKGIGRTLKVELLQPMANALMPSLNNAANWVKSNLPVFIANVKEVGAKLKEWLPILAAIGAGIATYLAVGAIMKFIAALKSGAIALKLLTAAQKALNIVMSLNPIGIIIGLIAALVVAFILLWNKSEEFREFWIGLWDGIKSIAETVVNALVTFFTETVPNAWNNFLTFCSYFIDNIVTFFSELPGKIWTWLVNAVSKIVTWGNDLSSKGRTAASNFLKIVVDIVQGLPGKIWTWLLNAAGKIITWGSDLAAKGREAGAKLLSAIVGKVREIPGKMLSIGGDIVKGLWNGINDKVSWITSKLSGFKDSVMNALKSFFGIGSPSKVMRDEIGRWLPEGIAVGIDKNAKSVLNSARELMTGTVSAAREGVNSGVSALQTTGAVSGGVINNFNQTINSPKPLSRLEIYRQSKNLLGYAGGGI